MTEACPTCGSRVKICGGEHDGATAYYVAINAMDALQSDIGQWSDGLWGDASECKGGMLSHLYLEVTELFDAPNERAVVGEAADCAMLLMDFVRCCGYSLHDLMREKLETNKKRQWGEMNPDGSVEHIRVFPPASAGEQK